MTRRLAELMTAGLLAGTLLTCSEQVAGGTGSEVECRDVIAGRVVHPDGSPAVHAKVSARPVDFLSTPVLGDSLWDSWSRADTVTDGDGRFCVCVPDSGSLRVSVTDDPWSDEAHPDSGVLLQVFKDPDSAAQTLAADTLGRTGSIAGRVNLPISDDTTQCRLLVYGMDRMAVPGIDRTFSVPGLPAGRYRVSFFFESPVPLLIHYPDSVEVTAGQEYDLA